MFQGVTRYRVTVAGLPAAVTPARSASEWQQHATAAMDRTQKGAQLRNRNSLSPAVRFRKAHSPLQNCLHTASILAGSVTVVASGAQTAGGAALVAEAVAANAAAASSMAESGSSFSWLLVKSYVARVMPYMRSEFLLIVALYSDQIGKVHLCIGRTIWLLA